MRGPRGGGADGGGVGSGVAFGSSRGVLRVRFGRGVAFDDSSASHSSNHSTRGALRCGKMSAVGTPPDPDRGAAQHRQRTDRRRDARYQRRRAGSLVDRAGRPGDPDHRPARRSRPGDRGVRDRAGAGRPGRLHRRAWPHPGRPDARGDRGGDRRDATHGRRSRGVAARAVGPARHALPRAEPQAGLADPVGRRPAEPERDRAGLVRRTAGRPRGRRPARPAARDAPDVERSRRAAPARARSRGRGRLAHVPARRGSANRRSPSGSARRSCGRPTRSSPPTRASRRSMSGSRPSQKAAGRPRSSWRTPRPWSSTISATTSGRPARPPGARRSARVSTSLDGRWRWSRSGPAAASTRCSATSHGSASTNRSRPDSPAAEAHGADDLEAYARRARELGGADVGIAVRARPRTGDTAVSIAIVTPRRERRVRRLVFLTGPMGRSRAALAATAVLLETLGD